MYSENNIPYFYIGDKDKSAAVQAPGIAKQEILWYFNRKSG
jgi:hypothetical protein